MSRAKKKGPASHPASKSVAQKIARSREARRATSPSIDTDKSLKDVPRAVSPIPLLAAHTNAGVHKSKKTKQKSRNQKRRQEKGLARAEIVMDRLEAKVEGSKKRTREINARRNAWDEVNGTGKEDRRKAILGDADMEIDENDSEWEDEDDNLMHDTVAVTKRVDAIALPEAAAGMKVDLPVYTEPVLGTDDEVSKIT